MEPEIASALVFGIRRDLPHQMMDAFRVMWELAPDLMDRWNLILEMPFSESQFDEAGAALHGRFLARCSSGNFTVGST